MERVSRPISHFIDGRAADGHDVEGVRQEEIASQAEDTLLSVSMNPHDAGDRTGPMILEVLTEQAGQVHRDLEGVRQLVSAENA
ncbi:MAG: hypothetical protein ACRERE_00020 [Candidatus Entotheonellia bacterium]